MMDYAVMEPLNQRIRMRYHMTGLTQKDAITYICSRLKWAGCAAPIFREDALAAIHVYSYGFPRLIGNICEESGTYAMLLVCSWPSQQPEKYLLLWTGLPDW